MVNISPDDLALELVNQCLRGNSHSRELLDALVRMASGEDLLGRRASHALFRVVVERLADEFEPCLCDSYASLFADVIETILQIPAIDLLERYRRVRLTRKAVEASEVIVLSRVTLGADVAVTSVLLDAAKRRYPRAPVWFAGPRKNYELFAGDGRVGHLEIPYPREGTLARRLANYGLLLDSLNRPGAIVIDPDSRLTQLGLLPVGEEDRYYFFESRGYGGYGDESLVELTRRWAGEVFGVPDAAAYIAPLARGHAPQSPITVSLGVGENHAKRLGDEFERELLQELNRLGQPVLVDEGGGEDEARRVAHAIEGLPDVRAFRGSFAAFASAIQASRLYCGYDSAGQHVAAACGVPLLTVFAGHTSARMFHRWRPDGPGPKRVVRVESGDSRGVLAECRQALGHLTHPV